MNRIEFYSRLNEYKDLQENKDSSLQHYGTLGQKWGVRKWQNADGTFNEAGKERYFGKKSKSDSNQKIGSNNKSSNKENSDDRIFKKVFGDDADEETREIFNMEVDDIREAYKNGSNINKLSKEFGYDKDVIQDIVGKEQKIGMTGIVDTVVTVKEIINAVHNYDDVQELRKKYTEFMNKSQQDYSEDERLSIQNNKKKIAELQMALENGDQERYNKLIKKVKDSDKAAVEKLLKDINETANKQKVSEENQEILDEHLGSISKPKIHKSYLNEDGTLNERGKTRTASNRKISDVASSVFLALRNINIFEAAATGIGGLILSFSGFGIPLALATTLASGIMAGAAGVDNALYKKLEKRADAYYEMLQ